MSPRRAASPSGRSSTEAGKTSETCLAMSCSVAVIPMKSGSAERADRGARLLAESRVGLVADHEVVRVAVELGAVPREPGVRLDRDRGLGRGARPGHERVGEALAVALGREVALELRDEEPTVREDQDAEVSRSFDEAGGSDRLARRGRVTEAIAAHRSRIRGDDVLLDELVVDEARVEVVVGVLVDLGLGGRTVGGRVAVSVAVLLGRALRRRDQLGEHARQRVDLVTA